MMIKLAITIILFFSTSIQATDVEPKPAPTDVSVVPENATKFSDNLHYRVIRASDTPNSYVTEGFVEYRMSAWKTDGTTIFNGDVDGDAVYALELLDKMLPDVATLMRNTPINEQRLWWINEDGLLPGYPGMADGDWVIDVEILNAVLPIPAPNDVDAIPTSATVLPSGLAYIILNKSNSTIKPKPESTVVKHYSGWTTDGIMFDSSLLGSEAKPRKFPVNQLIVGMTEALQLMSVGDSYRFWIPQNLAYGENPRAGAPKGMLVFDVELIDIEETVDSNR